MRMTVLALFSLSTVGCFSSVSIPETTYYRLRLPNPPVIESTSQDGVIVRRPSLAIRDVRLASDLAHDRIMVGDGPVRTSYFQFHQWSGPLDRLVADALRIGLSRSQRFSDVHEDPVTADLVLDAWVHRFCLGADGETWAGRATVEFRLVQSDGQIVVRRELEQATPVVDPTPKAIATALSDSLDRLVVGILAECEHHGVFDLSPIELAKPVPR